MLESTTLSLHQINQTFLIKSNISQANKEVNSKPAKKEVQKESVFGENTSTDDVSFSIRENDIGKNYSELRKQGLSRPKALDTLVEEYQDQNYDAKNPLPGYAQHEELRQEAVENIYRDIDEKLDNKISPYDIVKKLLLEYNTNMEEVLNENISDKVRELARLKGELYHAGEYLSEIRGLITPDGNRTDKEDNTYDNLRQTIGKRSRIRNQSIHKNGSSTGRGETRSYSLREERDSSVSEDKRGYGLGLGETRQMGESGRRTRESSTRSTTEWLKAINRSYL